MWWSIELTCRDADGLGAELFELGAGGVQIVDAQTLTCYFEGQDEDRLTFCKQVQKLGATIRTSNPVENKNWIQECRDVWEPLRIGSLNIVPFISLEEAELSSAAAETIAIIPGNGFGTGH